MNFHTFPAVLFIPLRPSCLFFSSYAASLCGTVLFVSWKPKGALWSCEKQLLTSCFSSCACAQHGPYRFVACICNMCVYLPMHMHAKKMFCVHLLFLDFAFSAKCESNMFRQSFESGPDLHIPLRIHGGKLWVTHAWKHVWCLRVWMTYAFSRLASRDVFCTNRLDARLKSSSAHSCNKSNKEPWV